MEVTVHGRMCQYLSRLSRLQGGLVLSLGLVVFLAWVFDLPSLQSLRPGLHTMRANTALGFVLSGVALVLVGLRRSSPAVRRAAAVSAGLVTVLGGLTLAQYLFDVELGIDQLFVKEPGRMPPNSALCFVLVGLALAFVDVQTRWVGWPSQILAALAGVVAMVGFVSYLYGYGQVAFPGLGRYTQMAIHTTVGFLLLSLGIFHARPQRGFMRVVTHSGLGGVLARWLLLPALTLPILLGALVLSGYRAEAFTLPFALALIATGNVVAFTALVWGAAFALDRVEARRLRGEEERMRLVAREQAARAEAAAQQRERSRAEHAEQEASALASAQRFLSEAGVSMSTSLDEAETLATLTQLAVPRLGDWCVVDLVGPDGATRQVAGTHVDEARAWLLSALAERHPTDPEAPDTLAHVLRTGRSVLLSEVDEPRRLAHVLGLGHVEPLHVLGVRSAMLVPLLAHGTPFGAITFVSSQPERRLGEGDLSLAEEFGRRAAVAVENARLFHEAQQAVSLREEVLAVVSHDLKNPLGSISLSVQLLRRLVPEGEQGERMRKHTRTIEHSVERMDRLIRDLLDMASIHAGQVKLELGRYAADDLVREGLVLLEPLAIQKRIELRTRLCRERLWVNCDRDRVYQVLSNLVGNALKFTPEEGRVTVEVEPEGDFVRFSVKDTGPGLPAEALPHLFQPFWQARRTARQGTGLGLFISRGIVEAHGGGLEVDSQEGRGSTFSFTLPRASLTAERERAPESPVH
ncbi:HAMP domain-containing sensor histidine kinase [Archangium sp.]|uniref:HAMP domain-containing sensor histidine kinase n=1 Tax=Archangium sp. TaxID=1872627 RepID=UPI00286ABADA|nr:HAMP domain-containing sensor histidine kinase [Archangium sp.]